MAAQAELLRVPADLLPFPLVVVRMTGIVAAVNRAFATQLSRRVEDVVGQPLSALVTNDPQTVAENMRMWSRCGAWSPAGLTFRGPASKLLRFKAEGIRFVPPDCTPHVLVRLVPMSEAREHFTRLNRHIADLTDEINRRKRLEAERLELLARERAAREQAELANSSKDEFLATLSHELRTPLNVILGWTRMLRDQRTFALDELDRGLAVVERNAKLQTQLVEDLLDVSRIVTGKLRIEFVPLDVAMIVASAVDAVRPAAANKGLQLCIDVDVTAARVKGDAARLEQVVWNLLANSVKFTPEGGRVSIRVRRNDGHAEIVVTDTGQGIAPEFLPYVFDRFRQGDGTVSRSFGGLGLGLALVRAFTEAHGGSVDAVSAGVGHGATFTVRLPLDTSARLPETV